MKKAVAVLALLPLLTLFSFAAPSVNAKSAVVMNAQTGEVVFEKNAHVRRSMASTTKIMTAVLALESGKMLETVTVTPEMTGADGTSIGLKVGYKIRLLDLLYGLMLESGNDAADAIAVYIGGSREKFAVMMNRKADEIGMTDTNFVTASGLDNENHYTTAYDMALLGSYAVKKPAFKEICSCKTKSVDFDEPDVKMTFSNHNRLLSSYDGAIGIKTGFTKKSGRCLVSAAERGGICFVCVTLNDADDWNDHRKMLDFAFENVSVQSIDVKNNYSVAVEGAAVSGVKLEPQSDILNFSCGEKKKIETRVCLPEFVYAPLKKGDSVGKIEYYIESQKIAEQSLVCVTDVQANIPEPVQTKSLFRRFIERIKRIGE